MKGGRTTASEPSLLHTTMAAIDRQWPKVSDFVARFCTLCESKKTRTCENHTPFACEMRESHALHAFFVWFSYVRVFLTRKTCKKMWHKSYTSGHYRATNNSCCARMQGASPQKEWTRGRHGKTPVPAGERLCKRLQSRLGRAALGAAAANRATHPLRWSATHPNRRHCCGSSAKCKWINSCNCAKRWMWTASSPSIRKTCWPASWEITTQCLADYAC